METPVMFAILTSAPSTIKAEEQVISFNRKSTKNSPVDDADKFRCVVAPKFDWGIAAQPETAQGIFATALEEVIAEAAGNILKDFWMDGKPQQIPADRLTFAAVMERMAKEQTSQRLNGDSIKAWYDASQTAKDAASRYGDTDDGKKKAAALREKFISLASNNPAIMPQLATKMLSYVAEADASNTVCAYVVKKLARLAEVNVNADDL